MVKKPRPQSEEVLKMEEDRRLVHVAKFACEKCGQKIIGHLWAPPEDRITDEIRKEHTVCSKEVHRDECKGRLGIGPQSYRSTRGRPKSRGSDTLGRGGPGLATFA